MPISYRISELEVENFRGLPALSLDLPSECPLYLIGGNNAGKSTVLNALALALRGGGFHTFQPEKFDFFHKRSGEPAATFRVDLVLDAAVEAELPAVQGIGDPTCVHGIRVSGTTEKGGRLTHRHQLLNKKQQPILLSPRTPLKGVKKDQFQDHGLGWSQRYARPDDIRDHLPEVWLLTPENLGKSLYAWKTGPLARLSQILSRRFLTEAWEFEFNSQPRRMPETLENVHSFFRAAVSAFPFWQNTLKPQLESALSQYLGRHASFDLRPDILTIEEWLTQQLAASFAADAGGATTPLDRMGEGWQALVRVAALDVLRSFPEDMKDRVVVLFEEPETYLHPHLRRKLRVVLEQLASQGWVVVVATHSPEFVCFGSRQQVTRLWRTGELLSHGSISSSLVSNSARFQERLDEHGNHEFLFSSKAVIVEGKDDFFAVRCCLAKLSVDLDARGVTILGVGGVENIPEYAKMASRLKVPWCAITDEDKQPDGSIRPKTCEVRAALEQRKTDRDLSKQWPVDLERCLGISTGKATPQWQATNLDPLTLEDAENSFPELLRTCREVKHWIESLDHET